MNLLVYLQVPASITVKTYQKVTKTCSTTPYHAMLKKLTVQCVGSFIGEDSCVDPVGKDTIHWFTHMIYSYDLQCFNCTDSNYNWITYVTAAFIPLTVFYVIILWCRFSATSPQLYAFVNFSQAITISANV